MGTAAAADGGGDTIHSRTNGVTADDSDRNAGLSWETAADGEGITPTETAADGEGITPTETAADGEGITPTETAADGKGITGGDCSGR